MKLIQFKCLSIYNRILAFLLGILGYTSSCIPGPMEYGMPHATFKIKGTVQSSTTEQFIPNIKVIMGYDSTMTDNDGNFEISQNTFPEEQTFIMQLVDIDGATNGLYSDIDTTILFENPVFTNGDGKWNQGETEQTIQIRMNPLSDGK